MRWIEWVARTEPSPPAHVRTTFLPAVILAGGFVKAIIVLVLWAMVATTKVAHARRVRASIVIVFFLMELMREGVLKMITF